MHKWSSYVLGALLASLLPLGAVAQDPSSGRFGQAIECKRENSSRLPSNQDCGTTSGETLVTTTEVPTQPLIVTLPGLVIANCEAIVSLKYSQRGAIARVEGEIENETCPASTGSFTLSIRTANEQREQTTQDYEESWQRDDDQTVLFSRDYPIGDDVDLIRVRTLRSTCKCTAAAE